METPVPSIVSVKAWAEKQFSPLYKQFPGEGKFKVQPRRVVGSLTIHCSLIVGTKYNKAQGPIDIIAWRSDSRIAVGYIRPNRGSMEVLCLEKVFTKDIEFYEPFCFTLITRSAISVARFEALVRYFFLVQGHPTAVEEDLQRFTRNFPGACEDLAAGVARKPRPMLQRECDIKMEVDDDADLFDEPTPCEVSRRKKRCSNGLVRDSRIVFLESPSPSPPLSPQRIRIAKIRSSTTSHNVDTVCKKHSELRYQQVSRSQHIQTFPEFNQSSEEDGPKGTEEQTVSQLRKKLFDANIKLMIVEGLARTSEQEATLWKGRYEELKQTIVGASE